MPNQTSPLLEVRHLSKVFESGGPLSRWRKGRQQVYAVQDASLSIGHGEVVGIAGESGAGKSTVARCILGLEQPTSGTIELNGVGIERSSRARHQQVCRLVQPVFQDPRGSLNPRMTVTDIVQDPLRRLRDSPGPERRQIATEALRAVGLGPEIETRYRHQLSGGQQQRVSIARALAASPSLVVLDEPVSALDASVRGRVLALLQRLREERHIAFLYISHDLATVRSTCDRVIVMRAGRVIEVGPVRSVFDMPHHSYTKLLLAASLDLDTNGALNVVDAAAAEGGLERLDMAARDVRPDAALVEVGPGHFVLAGTGDLR